MKSLSGLEEKLMGIIWNHKGDLSTRELVAEISKATGYDYARTTIVTVLKRIQEKGYIISYRIGMFAFIHAKTSKKEYIINSIQDTVQYLCGGDYEEFKKYVEEGQKPEKE